MGRDLLAREVQNLDRFWGWPVFSFVPSKLDEEKKDGYTAYVKIDLDLTDKRYRCCVDYDPVAKKCKKTGDCYADAAPEKMTAVYVPDHFKAAAETDLIIYLHGFLQGYPGMLKKSGKTLSPSIRDYLNYSKASFFDFRKIINDSGKNVVFVAPTLGAKSQAGNLAANFDGFVVQAIAAVDEYVFKARGLKEKFSLGKIVLAAHSGGGAPMLAIAQQSKSVYAKRIKSYWGFDSWYNLTCVRVNEKKECVAYKNPWDDVAKDASVSLYAYHFDSDKLPRAAANVCLKRAEKLDHFTLLPHYFAERLAEIDKPFGGCPPAAKKK